MAEPLWFKVAAGFTRGDEAKALERRFEDERAWAYAVQMWEWFVERHPEGAVHGPDAAFLVARGSGWKGDPEEFCRHMVAVGLLDQVPEGFRVHNWAKWAGFHIQKQAKDADRKRKSRGQSEGPPSDVTVTSHGQEVGHPCDPSYISSLSVSSASEGVQGEARRPRLVSPFGSADPYPATTAVLAALYERGIDAAPPAEKSAPRVEAAVAAVTVAVAVERLLPIYADPSARKPLTYHVAAIRSEARKPSNTGDLGCDLIPWYQRLTDDEVRAYRQERRAIAPDLDDAPIGITGPEHELADLNSKWRMVTEARS